MKTLHTHTRVDFTGNVEHQLDTKETEALTLQIRGLDIKNKEPGPFGLGRSDPFYEIARKYEAKELHTRYDKSEVEWIVVYRSEPIKNHLNPMWQPLELGMEKCCGTDINWPLKVTVFDHNRRGKHRLIGEFETTVKELQGSISTFGNADRSHAIPLKKVDGDEQTGPRVGAPAIGGYICVLKAAVGPISYPEETKDLESAAPSIGGNPADIEAPPEPASDREQIMSSVAATTITNSNQEELNPSIEASIQNAAPVQTSEPTSNPEPEQVLASTTAGSHAPTQASEPTGTPGTTQEHVETSESNPTTRVAETSEQPPTASDPTSNQKENSYAAPTLGGFGGSASTLGDNEMPPVSPIRVGADDKRMSDENMPKSTLRLAAEKRQSRVLEREQRQESACSKMIFLSVLMCIAVLVSLILAVSFSSSDKEVNRVESTIPAVTRDSFYNDYLNDLMDTLNGTQNVGYLSGYHALDPQAKALSWLKNRDKGYTLEDTLPALILERYAMAVFYYATEGTKWDTDSVFLTPSSVCSWNGNYGDVIRCNAAKQVIDINFSHKDLKGTLPKEIGLFFNMQGLWLSNNEISGQLPTHIGLLTSLEHLYLSFNQLVGNLPREMQSLQALRKMHIQENPGLNGNLDTMCSSLASPRNFYGVADCLKETLQCSCCACL